MSAGKQQTGKAMQIVNEHRARVVEKVLADMERDGLRWSEPYLPSLTPNNPVSGTVYSGGNRIHLAFTAAMRGFEDNRWCTFNQIRDNGWKLMKGSKAAIVEKWRQFAVKGEDKATGEEKVKTYLRCVGYWSVFNAEEIEGMPPAKAPEHLADGSAELAEILEASSRCPVRESARYAGSAAYSPLFDYIRIAPRETFRSDEAFTRVLLHEMTHSTGHESALARDLLNTFGSPEYAQEELVAELGSLFLSADLGLQGGAYEGEFYENHVSYLQSWMKALQDDPSYLFKAAAKADKADSFIMERYEGEVSKRREIELGRGEKAAERAGERKSLGEAARENRSAAGRLDAERGGEALGNKNVER